MFRTTSQNKNHLATRITLIVLISMLSLGFWNFGRPKPEPEKKTDSKASEVPSETAPREVKVRPMERSTADAGRKIEEEKRSEITPDTVIQPAGTATKDPDIPAIEKELQGIITRTHHLQRSMHGDRSEIEKIMSRAQVHERILRNLAATPPVNVQQTQRAGDIEAALQREKLRLLAEQVDKAQATLNVIETSQRIRPVEVARPPVIVRETVKPVILDDR